MNDLTLEHPYSNLPATRFWSSGVMSPVNAQSPLAIEPLINLLSHSDIVVSGGSCFAQYIGMELTDRNYHYLRSQYSGERIESFGLGNIYTVAQLKQWLEFSLDNRAWAADASFCKDKQWYDYLLPHRAATSCLDTLLEHRQAVKNEFIQYLTDTNVFIFTIGLTESWRNASDDIYPTCPGTVIGQFDASQHFFHNCTYQEICSDLNAIETMLISINPRIRIVYTVSPVPLTATASDDHVLTATTYSKAVIRAALGQHCPQSSCTSYFPSFELINHHTQTDWRFAKNLRSVSEQGVNYVMNHAFCEGVAPGHNNKQARPSQKNDDHQEALCEEALLESYSKSANRALADSDIILVGDSHMAKIATGFEVAGIDVIGGMVMNGSGFTDQKFELSDDSIFIPLENNESKEIWSQIHTNMVSQKGTCHIVTNIGFQTHRSINLISNELDNPILTEDDVNTYFEHTFKNQIHILKQLTQLGKVWLLEDPNFYAFIKSENSGMTVRAKNFHQYVWCLRKIAESLGIEYLNPCDSVLHNQFKDTGSLCGMVGPDGFHGTQTYYERCAAFIGEKIRHS